MASARPLPSASFDALLRLAKLDDSIQDALATRVKLERDLESLMESTRDPLEERDKFIEAEDRLKTTEFAKMVVEKQLERAQRRQDEKRASLRSRRQLMASDLERRSAERNRMQASRADLSGMRSECDIKRKAVESQRRRICEDLQRCFPISPVPHESLSFTIHGIRLPNSDELDAASQPTVAAALSLVGQAVASLSIYLQQPLVYDIHPHGSASTVTDSISLLQTNSSTTWSSKDSDKLRTYPLFSQGVPRFRFEYGVFLLNKDIQFLLHTFYNVRVLDIRHTLPNLKYLLYVATAGEGELPARKAGGVKGLLRAQATNQPGMAKRGSDTSTSSALSGILWRGTNGNRSGGAIESLRRNMTKAGSNG